MPEEESKQSEVFLETAGGGRREAFEADFNDPVALIDRVYQLCWKWADFHLQVTNPTLEPFNPRRIIEPATIPGSDEFEFVYPIHDYGNRFSTSKAQDMFSAGLSMCKLYFTIEKIIALLVERLKSGGVGKEDEVIIAFGGHELAQRKAFESVINLSYNVVVSNFDPGQWGEKYLQNIKVIAEKGFGYPPEAPRDTYQKAYSEISKGIKR